MCLHPMHQKIAHVTKCYLHFQLVTCVTEEKFAFMKNDCNIGKSSVRDFHNSYSNITACLNLIIFPSACSLPKNCKLNFSVSK